MANFFALDSTWNFLSALGGFFRRVTMPVACPDPSALHLFTEPWTKLQGYSQELPTQLSPEQFEFIFEYILNGCGKGIESLPLQRNEYFQIKSMKTALSTNRGIELCLSDRCVQGSSRKMCVSWCILEIFMLTFS